MIYLRVWWHLEAAPQHDGLPTIHFDTQMPAATVLDHDKFQLHCMLAIVMLMSWPMALFEHHGHNAP